MSAVEITISGVLYDKLNRTTQQVVLIGEATLTGLGVGGGPMPGGPPLGIWPNPPEGQAPLPSHPIMLPGMPGWGVPPGAHPSHPIALPGDPWWPTPPPQIPPPGSPPVMIPGTQPVHPIAVPPAIIVDYPGIGKVLVPQPTPPATP